MCRIPTGHMGRTGAEWQLPPRRAGQGAGIGLVQAQLACRRGAAVFGDVILVSVPYGALPQLGRDLAGDLEGKEALETRNPIPWRDGNMAIVARARQLDTSTPVYGKVFTSIALCRGLGLAP